MTKSIPNTLRGLYKLSPSQRIDRMREAGIIGADEARTLRSGGYTLGLSLADKMIENVVGVFGLPIGLVSNLRVNGKDYLVPMVVEEPSIVAAASAAAGLALRAGGFKATASESLLAGQIELNKIEDIDATIATLNRNKSELLDRANAVHPNMLRRGGGAKDIEIRRTPDNDRLVLHLLVDTCDAMGANLVNSQCEALAPWLEDISGAKTGLKILSNLADRSLVSATVILPCTSLARGELSGAEVRDAIVAADYFARTDRYRAVTHNKGILNGIDPIAIATGNDWRAISAGAHAFAARDGDYRGLTQWSVTENGDLRGELTLPLKTATVGASIAANPGAKFCLALTGVQSARELSQVMAAVGLAQNFAAIRALATTGIQSGHMKLHARSVVAAEGITGHLAPVVLKQLIASGEIKGWKAREL
ncbi:MAG: hydroxymethylglutaryl-CoA reductase, degradative, partial [Pseudomonadota bacterium]